MKRGHPIRVCVMRAGRLLQLAMETLDHTFRLRVISCNSVSLVDQQLAQLSSLDSNWRLLSMVMTDGTPKQQIQPLKNALATVSACIFDIRIASGHRLNLSTQVHSVGPGRTIKGLLCQRVPGRNACLAT